MSHQKILSISYDSTLLHIRQLLLETRAYEVTSSFGYRDSLVFCAQAHWDLIIIGHSIPDNDKYALVAEFRRHCKAPVLALHRFGEPVLHGADHTITPEHPEQLLTLVDEIFEAAERGRAAAHD